MDEKVNSVLESVEKRNWHDKHHKLLLLIPLIIILGSIVYLVVFYNNTGDFMHKDISLTGGTSATIYENRTSVEELTSALSGELSDLNARSIYDFGTNNQKALIVETTDDWDSVKSALEDFLGYPLIEGENVDVEFTGSSLSESFYNQLLIAILVAFICMAIVVFIIFRSFVPSITVVSCAFLDILLTLVVVDLLGIKMSTAGIVALLMLIGYSVDTDILLTTRMLKRSEGSVNERITGAFKTGMTMTLTSLFAIGLALAVTFSFSVVLSQIFTIIVIGLFFDILNTWITNVSILKIYIERKKRKGGENEARV